MSGPDSPRVVIAAPLYNKARYLPLALESLLAQTYRDFALVLVDDASDDATPVIGKQYAEQDSRIVFERQTVRQGMLENTRAAYSLARALFPEAPYWALGSDHDIWLPTWLDALVRVLDEEQNVVMAFPHTQRIDQGGQVIREPWEFVPGHFVEPRARFRSVYRTMVAGDMIYGLFRARQLDSLGLYRAVLVPDRLLLSELSLRGEFRQVPEVLWQRRFRGLAELDRQRRAFFLEREPAYVRLPYWVVHAAAVFEKYVLRGAGAPEFGRAFGIAFTLDYLYVGARHRLWRRRRQLTRRYRRIQRRVWRYVRRSGRASWAGIRSVLSERAAPSDDTHSAE